MTLTRSFGPVLLLLVASVIPSPAGAQAPDGAAIFDRHCVSCHNGVPENRAPSREVLASRSPEAILASLTAGAMRPQGGRLTGAERRAVAEFLSGRPISGDMTGSSAGRCGPAAASFPDSKGSASWSAWSPSPGNTRFQPAAQAGLTEKDVPRLTLKWALGFPDATSAWSQPTIAGGRLFVGSQNGTVYALDAKSGCIAWTFTAKTGVRTAPVVGVAGGNYTVYFGDTGANVYALDASTGSQRWMQQVDEHPYARVTGSPLLDGETLIVPVSSLEETAAGQPGYECCTFRGQVTALDARSGRPLWKTHFVPPPAVMGKNAAGVTLLGPSGVATWSAPTPDRKRGVVYITTGNTYSGTTMAPLTNSLIALDPKDGHIAWSRPFRTTDVDDVFGCRAGAANCTAKTGPDYDFGTPALLVTRKDGRDVILLGQKSGVAWAVDPDRQGEVLWEYRAGQGSLWGGIQWGMATDGEQLFIPVSDIRTPDPGGLHAVDIATGERRWYQPPPPVKCGPAGPTCNPALISAPTVIPGVLFSGSNDGGLRAYSTKDGSVLWEFDTNREFLTLNNVRATGGAIQGPGPAIVDGMLYLNAGYGDHLGRAGNVLLAFGVP